MGNCPRVGRTGVCRPTCGERSLVPITLSARCFIFASGDKGLLDAKIAHNDYFPLEPWPSCEPEDSWVKTARACPITSSLMA